MKHSIATVSLAGTLTQKLEASAVVGYDGIELFETDLTVSDISPRTLRERALDLNLEIVAMQPFRDFEAMPEDLRERNLERAKRKMDLMAELGTRRLLICSNISPLCLDDRQRAAEDLHVIGDVAAEYDFQIGYEALAWGRHVNEYQQSWEIVQLADHAHVGIVLDSFHVLVKGSDLAAIRMIPAEKIVLVQLADAPRLDMGHLYLSRHYRCFPGQGSMPVEAFCAAVKSTGYTGYLSHEIFSDKFRASRIIPTAQDGKRSLIWLDRLFRTDENLKNAAGTLREAVSELEFIEFSADETTQAHLLKLLAVLGFCETHRHKRKDVSLYQLGNVNIVLNRQTASHAYSYFLDHGVAVCAMGLSAASPQATHDWARALNYEDYESNTAAGELEMPTVKGPGDVLYYFIGADHEQGRFFEVDFNPTGRTTEQNGITAIDHIAQVVVPEHYLSATLFYRVVLGLAVEETIEINDPYGVVTSRLAHNASGGIRIPLTTSRNWGAAPRRFIEVSSGGGIQQIALATKDIFKTAAYMDPDVILPIPENYYRDLAARQVLSDAETEKLSKYNILYDGEGEDCFLHFYTRTFNGLFFEILQRRGNYRSFGETNAHVRLAAQARERFRYGGKTVLHEYV